MIDLKTYEQLYFSISGFVNLEIILNNIFF